MGTEEPAAAEAASANGGAPASDGAPSTTSDAERAPMVLKTGDMVELVGLKAAPELNGLQGQLNRLDSSTGRWEVKLADGEVKALKPDNLQWKSMGPIDDDGTLMLAGMASDHKTVQEFTQRLGAELPKVNETLQLINAVIGPMGGAAAKGEEAGIWVKLAFQAEKRVRSALEDIQKHLEALDSVDMAKCGSDKGANDLRMARKDLVLLAQAIQERLEIALGRLIPVFQRLKAELPQKKHGWGPDTRDEAPLHEKYREAFSAGDDAKAEEQRQKAEAAEAAAKVGLKPIVVKYQGRGEKLTPSDNLYVKALPGWITEEDMQAIFSPSGVIQSMKLKTADWGAIAFVRLASKKEAAAAIQALDGKIPERLQKRADEQDAQRRKKDDHAAELQAVMDQLERGVILVFDLSRPLGMFFKDTLLIDRVQEASQAAELGVRRGWQVRSVGGIDVRAAKELVKKIQKLKTKGFTEAAIAFSPPPIVVTFTERPFGFAVAKQEDVGLMVVQDVKGKAYDKGVRPGAVLTMVQGMNVSSLAQDEVIEMLKEAVLPAELAFEQSQAPRGPDGRPLAAVRAPKMIVELQDSDDEGQEDNRKMSGDAEVATKLVIDLAKPLGIHFDSELCANKVQDGSQAAALGVLPGWKVRSIGGVQLQRTEQLVDRIKGLKVQGETSVSLVFARPAGAAATAPSKRPAPVPPQPATVPGKVLQVDLSQPLGITFTKDLEVNNVSEGSQGFRLGVGVAWRALAFAGQPLRDISDLVGKIKEAKTQGLTTAAVSFSVPTGGGATDKLSKTLKVDVMQPLGINFDNTLVIHAVADGSQAAKLGIEKGWRLRSLSGVPLQNTAELVSKLKQMKERMEKDKSATQLVTFTFALPVEEAPVEEPDLKRPRPRPAKAAKPDDAGQASVAAGPAGQAPSGDDGSLKDVELDLSQSLGMHFSEDLCVESVREGAQASWLNIKPGWRVSAIAGQALNSSAELVTTIEALKAHDVKSVTLSFAPKRPATAATPELPAKRARTAPAVAASASDEAAAAAAEAAIAGAKAAAAALAKASAVAAGAKAEAAAAGAKAAAAAMAEEAAQAGARAAAAAAGAKAAAAAMAEEAAQAGAKAAAAALAKAKAAAARVAAAPAPAPSTSEAPASAAPGAGASAAPAATPAPPGARRYQLDMDLSKPLGINFDGALTAKAVQPGSQAAALGVSKGWSVHAVGDVDRLESTPDLVAAVKALKAKGVTKARFTFAPGPPVVVTFAERPFGFSATFSATLGSVVIAHSSDQGALSSSAVRTGSVLVSLGGRGDTSTLGLEELNRLLGEVELPVEVGFQEAPRFSATMSLDQPLGINFDTELRVKKLMDGTQAATMGIGKGWQVHTLDGKPLSSTPELVAAVKQLKEQGVASMLVDFFPTSEA